MLRSLPLAALALALGTLALGTLAGCDGQLEGEFNQKLVVSANLGTDEPLPPVSLSESSPLLEPFDPSALVVRDAEVTVTLLAADGSDEEVYAYAFQEGRMTTSDDLYVPVALPRPVVLPGRTYRLDVRARETLTATTTVPARLEVVQAPGDRVVYGVGQGPEIRIRQSSAAGRQAAFVASTRALAAADFDEVAVEGETFFRSVPNAERFLPVPVYQRFLDCEPEAAGTILCGDDPGDARTGTSPVINEGSYVDLGDGTVLVQVPFLAFGFYGPYQVSLTSLDRALQDFVQTQAIQGGGTTLSPGEIPNVTSNIQGGLGVFGSYSQVTVNTAIAER